MKIKQLSLTNYRGFKRLEIDFENPWTLILGDNAQGKTSILEAIHFLSVLTSSQTTNDRQVINLASMNDVPPFARIQAGIEKSGKDHRLEIRLILNESSNGYARLKKEIFLDNINKRIFESVGFFTSVLFLPQMMQIIEDSPDNRRKYLDEMISQAVQGYIKTLSDYQRALSQRNALLRNIAESNGDYAQLNYWDNLLAENGSKIIQQRWHAICEVGEIAVKIHLGLSNKKETLEMVYYPSLFISRSKKKFLNGLPNPEAQARAAQPLEKIYEDYLHVLMVKRREDVARGLTTTGPHRDDLLFYINDQNIALYGSRGQIRTTMLSLKLAETKWLYDTFHEQPVILLDETMAELDVRRREDLIEYLMNENQVVLTTADLDFFPDLFLEKCCVKKLHAGKIA
jgi:DNA replication and repair protein RecF